MYTGTDLPPTGDRAILFKTTRDFPLVTLAAEGGAVAGLVRWCEWIGHAAQRENGSGRSPLTSIRGMPVPKVEASSATASRPRIRKGGFRACATRTGLRWSHRQGYVHAPGAAQKVKGVRANPGDGWIDVSWNEIDVAT